jgi:hypothetical protein
MKSLNEVTCKNREGIFGPMPCCYIKYDSQCTENGQVTK